MNMKFLLAAPLLAACALTSPLALAASTDLQLNGQIVAGACNISVTGGGVYDFGDIPNTTVTSTGTNLGVKTQTIDLTCAAPLYAALALTDNREGTEFDGTISAGPGAGSAQIGLNRDHAGNPIGYAGYRLSSQPVVDGQSGKMLTRISPGDSWTSQSLNQWIGLARTLAFTDTASSTPSPVTTVSTEWEIGAFVAPRESLDMSRGLDLDGSVTVELTYL